MRGYACRCAKFFASLVSRGAPLIFVAAFLVAICIAQEPKFPAENDRQVSSEAESFPPISTAVTEVYLNFTVTGANGKFIKNLRVEDFSLLDNLRPPERMTHFQAHTDAPIRAVLLFDISSSIRYRFDFEVKAANEFLQHVLRPSIDKAAIVSFGSEVREVQPMTNDLKKLTSSVAGLKPGGETALHDAIIRASRDLRAAHTTPEIREIIIIVSDGTDTASQSSAAECEIATITSGGMVFVVDASIPLEQNSPGQTFLRRLAETSGGLVLPARRDSELKNAFRTIEEVLRNQYTLGYKPSLFQTNGIYRTIELKTKKRRLAVHARRGYFATAN